MDTVEEVELTTRTAADELLTDIEILQHKAAAYDQLVKDILANNRLAWDIVDGYLKANGNLLTFTPEKMAEILNQK